MDIHTYTNSECKIVKVLGNYNEIVKPLSVFERIFGTTQETKDDRLWWNIYFKVPDVFNKALIYFEDTSLDKVFIFKDRSLGFSGWVRKGQLDTILNHYKDDYRKER